MSANHDSTPAIDITRAPNGEMAAARLVAAVAACGDLAEDHYLELKGPPNLATKVAKAKVAKFILGAANRMPERAAEAFEGYGVMIVGITENRIEGVPPIERLALSQVIQPFLGVAGPRWDVVRVPLEDSANQVMVFIVDPPQKGQPPFICRANGEGLQSGRIYYRGDGETREPTADELDLLMARGATRLAAPVELKVTITEAVVPLTVDEKTLDELIGNVRRRLLAALPKPETKEPLNTGVAVKSSDYLSTAMGASSISRMWAEQATAASRLSVFAATEDPENRSEEEYKAEIDAWEERFRKVWAGAVELFVIHALPATEITVVNQAQTFLHDVEVKIHLDRPVLAVECSGKQSGLKWSDLQLPPPPRKWGPRKRELGFSSDSSANLAASLVAPWTSAPISYSSPDVLWTTSGTTYAEVAVGDLRPEATFQTHDGDVVLIIKGQTPEQVRGSWTATVRGYNEVFTGELELTIAEPTYITGLIREFFHLDQD